MSVTYADQIIENLENLLSVAVFHPRLAVLGIESEFEVMFGQMIPESYLRSEVEEYAFRQHPYPETAVVRRELHKFARDNRLPEELRDFLGELESAAGDCRHSPEEIHLGEVKYAVKKAIAVVRALRDITWQRTLYCPIDKILLDLPFKAFLDRQPGATFAVTCPTCERKLIEVVVPQSPEAGRPHLTGAQSKLTDWATRVIAQELRTLLTDHSSQSKIAEAVVGDIVQALDRLLGAIPGPAASGRPAILPE